MANGSKLYAVEWASMAAFNTASTANPKIYAPGTLVVAIDTGSLYVYKGAGVALSLVATQT